MTVTTARGTTTRSAEQTAAAFFDAYRRQDVDEMVSYCSQNAEFHYVPFEVWGKQRVVRGDGKVRSIGKVFWVGLIAAFPDLTNHVSSIVASEDGDVAVEVTIAGTQAAPWGVIAPRGQRFELPHLFVLHVDSSGLIDNITAYWDTACMYRQLGHLEVD